MSEGGKDAENSGKNGKASDLINAAIWIFIVSGFGIVTSGCYVSGLSTGLGFDFPTYFGVKDYLEVTPYWLLQILIIVLFLMLVFYRVKLEGKAFGRPIGDFIRRIPILILTLIVLGFLCLVFLISPILFAGLLILVFALALFWVLHSKKTEDIVRRLVGSIRSNALLWPGVTLLFTLCIVAYLVGFYVAPGVFWKKPMSTIYLAGSNNEVKGRVVFSLTKYLFAMREDPKTVVAIPVAKIDRIETPIQQATGSKTAPTTTPSLSMSTQTLNAPMSPRAQSSTPVSATPAPKLSPVPTPTLAPSPKPSLSPK